MSETTVRSETAPGVRLDLDADVAHVVLANPARGNALDLATSLILRDVVHEAIADPAVRTIVLRGEGRRFCVGGDLQAFREAAPDARLCDDVAQPLHDAIEALHRAPQPVVCVVQGAVGGGANGLVFAADIVLAARGTTFRMGYTGSGLSPDCSVTWELPRRVGLARAMDLVLTNRRVDADEAAALGMVSRVVDADDLDSVLAEVVDALRLVPVATLAETKRLVFAGLTRELRPQLDDEARTIGTIGDTSDTREAIAAFLDKRRPEYTR